MRGSHRDHLFLSRHCLSVPALRARQSPRQGRRS